MADTRRVKLLGIVSIVIGIILCVTIVGAIVGIPMIMLGVGIRKAYNHNLAVSGEALTEYVELILA